VILVVFGIRSAFCNRFCRCFEVSDIDFLTFSSNSNCIAERDEGPVGRRTETIAPHTSRRKRKTQEGRRLRCYERRWIVERFFAWIQWQRRLLVRWEYYPTNFLGFVQLATLCILLKQF